MLKEKAPLSDFSKTYEITIDADNRKLFINQQAIRLSLMVSPVISALRDERLRVMNIVIQERIWSI